MSKGFDLVFDQLVGIIRDIEPPLDDDQGFTVAEDGDGRAPLLDDDGVQDRFVTLTLDTAAYDAGFTGIPGEALRIDLMLSVRYNTGDRGYRTKKAGMDSGLLTKALGFPANWDGTVTGIDVVLLPDREDVDIEYDTDSDTLYLKMIFVVEYMEEN